VQIFTINRVLRPGSQQLKGHSDAEYFKDGNSVKYTIGSSANYQEMVSLRKTLLKDFPEAFVIAFKDGEKMDINKAIEESKK
jgi:N-acetylmuramoyl-L-alanine amidase